MSFRRGSSQCSIAAIDLNRQPWIRILKFILDQFWEMLQVVGVMLRIALQPAVTESRKSDCLQGYVHFPMGARGLGS